MEYEFVVLFPILVQKIYKFYIVDKFILFNLDLETKVPIYEVVFFQFQNLKRKILYFR